MTTCMNFAFDGYQIDQLGKRERFTTTTVRRSTSAKDMLLFIEAMKQAHPDKSLGDECRKPLRCPSDRRNWQKVDFFYNEMWADEADFTHLKAVLYENGVYGNNQLNTVFCI